MENYRELEQKYKELEKLYESIKQDKDKVVVNLSKLINISEQFTKFSYKNPNYNDILQIALDITGAKYGALNIIDEYGGGFTTVAFLGDNQISKLIGFEIIDKHWNYDENRDILTRDNIITKFNNIDELTINIIPKRTIYLINKLFNLGEVIVIRITRNDKTIGDFTLIFKNNQVLENYDFIKLYAHQIGMFLNTLISRNKLETINKELREKDELYRSIISASSDDIVLTDINGTIIMISPMGLSMFGYNWDDDVLGKNISEFFIKEDQERFYNNIQKMKTGIITQNGEYVGINKNGNILNIEINSGFINNNEDLPSKIVFIIRNITERKFNEIRLQQSEEKYKLIAENTLDGILTIDSNHKVSFISPSYIKQVGYTEEEILNTGEEDIAKRIHPDDVYVLSEVMNAINEKKLYLTYTYRIKHKLGYYIWREDSAKFNYDENNNYLGCYVICRNITERKERELLIEHISQELRKKNIELNEQNIELLKAKSKAEESEKLKSLFLANMSHEIRTPMNGIIGFTSLLKNHNLNSDDRNSYISIIEKSGERLLNIINDIINISKIEAGYTEINLSPTNLNEQLKYIYNLFKLEAEEKNIKLIINEHTNTNVIDTDSEKLYAILTNITKNAIKFTNNGIIEIGYKLKKESNKNYIEFFVKDTGIGIKKEYITLIFERFRQVSESKTRNYEGSGLGLTITKAYVELLGGKIWLESEEGKGTTFYFTIPINNKEEILFTKKTNEIKKMKNLKILIVEDDYTSRLLLKEYISIFSKETLEAKNGDIAVKICENNLDIDLVLMDIQMPVLSGIEATEEIRKFNKDVIIIAQSAYVLQGDKEKFIISGCNDYISKPINKNELDKLINKYFPNDK
jgi:PAS domain S-box-containing protein